MAGLRFLADRDRSESRTQRSSQWSSHYVEEQTSGLRSARLMARIAISSPGCLDLFPFGSDSSPTPPVSCGINRPCDSRCPCWRRSSRTPSSTIATDRNAFQNGGAIEIRHLLLVLGARVERRLPEIRRESRQARFRRHRNCRSSSEQL